MTSGIRGFPALPLPSSSACDRKPANNFQSESADFVYGQTKSTIFAKNLFAKCRRRTPWQVFRSKFPDAFMIITSLLYYYSITTSLLLLRRLSANKKRVKSSIIVCRQTIIGVLQQKLFAPVFRLNLHQAQCPEPEP